MRLNAMENTDDAKTVTSASSSGIENSDVTILTHDAELKFANEIENILKARNCTVAKWLCGGRSILDNLISCVRHANIKIILFGKSTAKKFQTFIECLGNDKLDLSTTLIFYPIGFNLQTVRKRFKYTSKIQLSDSPKEVACLIELLIRLHKTYNNENAAFVKRLFIDLLIHSVLNPSLKDKTDGITMDDCQVKFANKYGDFSHLEVGRFEFFVDNKKGFRRSGNLLIQSSKGKKLAKKWLKLTSFESSLVDETVLSIPENTESETHEWLEKCGNDPSIKENKVDGYTKLLFKHLGEFDSRFAFFLITNRLPASSFLSGIANIPWVQVFDFDFKSREDGLLSAIEKLIKTKFSFTISTMIDSPQTLSERALNWFFPFGFNDRPDTLNAQTPYKWYCKNKSFLEQCSMEIANFCSCRYLPVFLVLWYNAKDTDTKCLDLFLSDLLPHFASDTLTKKLVICTEEFSEDTHLFQIADKYDMLDTIVNVPLKCLCDWLAQAKVSPISQCGGIKLPKATSEDSQSNCVEMSDELPWIQQFIDILPLSSSFLQKENSDASENIGLDFVKGGLALWTDFAHGKVVEREKLKEEYSKIFADLLSPRKSIISFKILHAPGGGGTTFARQILWYLHTDFPCGVVIPQPTFSVTQLLERIYFLYGKCQLPIVLLIDGRSDYEVEQLYENCKNTVLILHVQRSSSEMKACNSAGPCILPGSILINEGEKLAALYTEYVPDKKEDLHQLASDITHQKKYLFEFGLTAFDMEFKGVQAYVKGYLELEEQGFDVVSNLRPWQSVVAFLSLVLFYSQGGLHKQVFLHLLNKEVSSFVSIEDLCSGQHFVSEMNKEWKINYHAVAKEILEQILIGSSERPLYRLSNSAKSNLHKLVISFINTLKRALGSHNSEHVFQQLSNVILKRDYSDVSDEFERRHSFSRLLEDVSDENNRVKILRCLTNAFPFHHEFHAHLGRMLNIMGNYNEAEESLGEALRLRIKEKKARGPDWPDNVLGRFYHMFGFACLKRAKNELTRIGIKPEVLQIVQTAVNHFADGRKYATYNRTYGYIGDVRVRLLIADFVHKSQEFPGGCVDAFNGAMDKKNIQLSEFIKESHYVCDQLLAECQRYTSEAELKKVRHFSELMQTFITCFKDVAETQPVWEKSKMNISIRRSQIASLKVKHYGKTGSRTPSVDDIESKEDAEKVLKLYEDNIREVLLGKSYSVSISYDVLEWLEIIRHEKLSQDYYLSEVLHWIEAWEKRNEIGYATYYLYIFYFLLAIYSPGKEISLQFQHKSEELRNKLRTNKVRLVNTRLTREWLADYELLTVRKLICRSKLGLWDKDTRFWKEAKAKMLLKVCTGIIKKSSHKSNGVIKLDVSIPKILVEISFYPDFYNLYGSRYADRSTPVEFFIGFSAERGAEALSVKQLYSRFCTTCKHNTKVITLNQCGRGMCAKCKNSI